MGLLINDSAVSELLEMRAMIEPDCAKLAAIRGSAEDLQAIAEILGKHNPAHRADRSVARFGAQFHITIARATGNQVAVAFMESILDLLMERGRRVDSLKDEPEREIAEHEQIFTLITKGAAEKAEIAMHDHIISRAGFY
ncbi:MAG: FadR family transcriptional regulator [Hyphomicrobiales bacterium]|nr:FadR family transcriptional regulator [Hyphomicrobiales bacterium]